MAEDNKSEGLQAYNQLQKHLQQQPRKAGPPPFIPEKAIRLHQCGAGWNCQHQQKPHDASFVLLCPPCLGKIDTEGYVCMTDSELDGRDAEAIYKARIAAAGTQRGEFFPEFRSVIVVNPIPVPGTGVEEDGIINDYHLAWACQHKEQDAEPKEAHEIILCEACKGLERDGWVVIRNGYGDGE